MQPVQPPPPEPPPAAPVEPETAPKKATPSAGQVAEPKPLLPPMFEEKDDSDFRLNGQLLYRDRELGVSRPLEGAELQFEFRQ
ncbi:hypothetical protein K3Z80_18055 [Pseudomonas aeruginosa]|nr:hypothetical protein [Pseudomonas aeruginosa]